MIPKTYNNQTIEITWLSLYCPFFDAFVSSHLNGPSGETRTPGFHIPNVAPYQLGYTRLLSKGTRSELLRSRNE